VIKKMAENINTDKIYAGAKQNEKRLELTERI
jgi:hypothetical protein